MRLHIEHETIFSYSQPVREAIAQTNFVPNVQPPTLATHSRYYEAQQQQQQ